MFDQFRDSLRSLSSLLGPEERRRVTSTMREALVAAKMGIADLRSAIQETEGRLKHERAELETVRRRMGLAAGIGDDETVAVAERFAARHAERVAVLETKLMAQQQELTMTERELEEMTGEMRLAMSGVDPAAGGPDAAARREVEDALHGGIGSGAGDPDFDAPVRRSRAEREADADDRLAALKRRMGK